MNDIISKASESEPKPVVGGRDSRRDCAERGLKAIAKAGYVIIENNIVRLSATSQIPQIVDCGGAA